MWIIFAQSCDKEYDLYRVMIYIKQNAWEFYWRRVSGDCVVGYIVILIQGVLLWENYC